MLKLTNLHVYYGVSHILKGIDLTVESGQIVTLIGANGAGKTTTLKTISGLVKSRQGEIRFSGESFNGATTDRIVKAGIIQVPEGRRVFATMTVLENLELGAYVRSGKAELAKDLANVYEIFPRLEERKSQRAGTLSGGEQQMLAIGRALMAKPKCLLLDEPSMGLAPIVVEEIFKKIVIMNRDKHISILLVEQNAMAALAVAHKGYVIDTGQIILADTCDNLKANDRVRKAYLGIT